MLIDYQLGQGSIVLRVKIRNSSVSTGAGLTGLTNSSSGLIISTIVDNEATATTYTQAASHIQTITTLGTFAAPSASNCRFKEVDAVNHPGIYEIQIADARFGVSSAKSVLISINGATNAAECDVLVPLRSVNPYDAVRGGMTALPNANANATGGLVAGVIRSATAAAGAAGSITLDAAASATNDFYKYAWIYIQSGTGAGQLRLCTGYTGSTQVATVAPNWATNPGGSSVFVIIPAAGVDAEYLGSHATATDIPNAVWDTILTTTLHNTANSAGRDLRIAGAGGKVTLFSGTATAGGVNTITLPAGVSTVNDIYDGDVIAITGGTGIGQSRTIANYVGSTKVVTVDSNWVTVPDNTSTFDIYASADSLFANSGTVNAATSSTVTLDTNASATNNVYNNSLLTILSGTGAGQTSTITGYVGSTRVATVSPTWAVTPDTSSAYAVVPATNTSTGSPVPTVAQIVNGVWNELKSLHTTSGSFAAALLDITQTTDPGAVSAMTDIGKMIVAVWRSIYKKKDLNTNTLLAKFYADNGSSVNATSSVSDNGITQTWGAMT